MVNQSFFHFLGGFLSIIVVSFVIMLVASFFSIQETSPVHEATAQEIVQE